MSPEEIRRIRERLGLSQVEAGELLGGGPRAFTKYESGTIKPAASVSNLLKLLDMNPEMLASLTGTPMRPINTQGARPFEVTAEHISVLVDRQLVSLTSRLLSVEAWAHNLPLGGIHVADNVDAPDGGEDARIQWPDGPPRTRFLPRRLNQFQVKATKITPAKAEREMIDSSGCIKPMVRSALEASGAYIMLCGRTLTQKRIQECEQSIRQILLENGLTVEDEQVQVRDASQIVSWVNSHPSVAVWVFEQTQPGLAGPFRSWDHWHGRGEHAACSWVEDPRLEPFRARLVELISVPRGVARVVGLSGVGKSRLVLEAFRPTANGESPASSLSPLVLYTVESETSAETVKKTVQNLADARMRAVIVVDRCLEETHQDLAAFVKPSSSRLSLVTIDHEIPKRTVLPDDSLLVEQADTTVIEGMLTQLSPALPGADQRRLVKFADGNPLMAVLIAQAWTDALPIASASDDTFIDRIILGRNPSDQKLLIEAAMLLGAFALVGSTPPMHGELEEVARLGRNRTADDLHSAFEELKSRGVVQQRGRLLTLQPRAIAFAMAERQWKDWRQRRWEEVLAGSLPEKLKTRAAERLALINASPIAAEVAQHVCRRGGVLDSLEELKREGNGDLLCSLAEIDTEIVANLLERVLEPLSTVELKGLAGDLRRDLVRTAEKIAFVSRTFERGARLLLDLAVAENENWANNATGQFKGLFPVVLGGTEADGQERLRFLDKALQTTDNNRLNILVEALLKGAKTEGFSRSIGAEVHGSRPMFHCWQPATNEQIRSYLEQCVNRLIRLASRTDEVGRHARSGLGNRLSGLVWNGLVDVAERAVDAITASQQCYWPEALTSLAKAVGHARKRLDAVTEERVKVLLDRLQPVGFDHRVQYLVTEMQWDYPIDQRLDHDSRRNRQIAAVEQLVAELLSRPAELTRLLPHLCQGRHRMASIFGGALAKQAAEPLDWQAPIVSAVAAAPFEERNFDLLTGYFAALAEREPQSVNAFKDEASRSDVFGPALPLLCWRIGISGHDIALACKALTAGTVPPSALHCWSLGRALGHFRPDELAPLFDCLINMDEQAFFIALDLMGMYAFRNKEALEGLRPQLRRAARIFSNLQKRTVSGDLGDAHFQELMKWLLKKGRHDADARAIAMDLAKAMAEANDFDRGKSIEPLLPLLLSEFPEITWPLLGASIAAGGGPAWNLQYILGKELFSLGHAAILSLPEDTMFAWCHANPDIAPAFVARTVPLLTSSDPKDPARQLHPIIRRLLDEFGQREDVRQAISINLHTFGWTGGKASYFALYREPFRELEAHPIGAVSRWAKRMCSQLDQQIKASKDEDDEERAQWGE